MCRCSRERGREICRHMGRDSRRWVDCVGCLYIRFVCPLYGKTFDQLSCILYTAPLDIHRTYAFCLSSCNGFTYVNLVEGVPWSQTHLLYNIWVVPKKGWLNFAWSCCGHVFPSVWKTCPAGAQEDSQGKGWLQCHVKFGRWGVCTWQAVAAVPPVVDLLAVRAAVGLVSNPCLRRFGPVEHWKLLVDSSCSSCSRNLLALQRLHFLPFKKTCAKRKTTWRCRYFKACLCFIWEPHPLQKEQGSGELKAAEITQAHGDSQCLRL